MMRWLLIAGLLLLVLMHGPILANVPMNMGNPAGKALPPELIDNLKGRIPYTITLGGN